MPELGNVFESLVLLCCIPFQNVSGVEVNLTRGEEGDYFENPYATNADYDDESFCRSVNATCFEDHPKQGDKCRYCKCDEAKTTFNKTSLRCASTQDIRQACRTKLSIDGSHTKLLDLRIKNNANLYIDIDSANAKMVKIVTANGKKVSFLTTKNTTNGRWKLKWRKVPKKIYDGQVFRVQIIYKIGGEDTKDCFVFKSRGSINVSFLNLITKKKENSSSGDGGGSNAVTVSLAVVGCLLLFVIVVLVVLLFRRRSARTSGDRQNTETSLHRNGNNQSPTIISQPESTYAEADSAANSPQNGEDVNHVYDYIDENLKDYASLDTSKVESKPVYQSQVNIEGDLNKQIPSASGETSTADGQTQDPSQIYHVLEEPRKTEAREFLGRTGNENLGGVCSTLEEENAPENCDPEVSEETGGDNPERVYSVLEIERNPPTLNI